MEIQPMDIDPIDDGPKPARNPLPMTATTTGQSFHGPQEGQLSEEEEARQAIDMLRGEDVSSRVAAASRLEAVAKILGEERTRDVSLSMLTNEFERDVWQHCRFLIYFFRVNFNPSLFNFLPYRNCYRS